MSVALSHRLSSTPAGLDTFPTILTTTPPPSAVGMHMRSNSQHSIPLGPYDTTPTSSAAMDDESRNTLLSRHSCDQDRTNTNPLSHTAFDLPPPSARGGDSLAFKERLRNSRKLQALVGALALCLVLVVIWVFSPARDGTYAEQQHAASPGRPFYRPPPSEQRTQAKFQTGKGKNRGVINYTFGDGSVFEKPGDVLIYGLVFYGRWDRVQILDCYLKVRSVGAGRGVCMLTACLEKLGRQRWVPRQGHLCRPHPRCG